MFMTADVKRVASNLSTTSPLTCSFNKHVDSTVDSYRSTRVYAKKENVDKKGESLPPSRLSSDAEMKPKNSLKCKNIKHLKREEKHFTRKVPVSNKIEVEKVQQLIVRIALLWRSNSAQKR